MSAQQSPPAAPRAELTLQAILASAAAGIITIDSAGVMLAVNPSAARMFGYEADELVGRNVSMLMPSPDRERHDGYIARYLTTGESRIMGIGREVVGARKDGTTFSVHLSIGQVQSADGPCFTGVMIDLTRQKLAEERFGRQQALFRAIFENLPDPVIIADRKRIVQHVNPAFERVFGYSAGQSVGQASLSLYETVTPDLALPPPAFPQIARGSDPRTQLLHYRRSNGETFPALSLRNLVVDRDGVELGYLCVVRDLSEEVRREEVLLKAQRMEAVGQLTGGVAHDFNNILTVILGNLELLEDKLAGDLERSLSREAREAAEMGARLTDRLLTFARRQTLERRRINLNEFVLGLSELLRRSIGEDIDLSTSLAGDLWLTLADPGQIENALLNLAINARDAMPTGGRLLIQTRNVVLDQEAVALIPGLEPGAYVVLSVTDTGHGMPEDVRARAFEPFFTTKGPGKGSGLGLATIYGFARQSGGNVAIYSEVSKGTAVDIFLPRADADSLAGATAPAGDLGPIGHGEVILVVEDDQRVRRLTSTRLKGLGYEVIEAESGPAALSRLESGPAVDLVFTDVVMPGGLSGLDLAREVSSRWPGTRIVLTSGYSDELARAGGATHYPLLRKPYRLSDLAAVVATALATAPPGGID